jgi:putative acetyltransferase
MDVKFREARIDDRAATRRVVHAAFGPEGSETAAFLDALRADGCILGEWIAEDSSGPLGHVVFSRAWLEKDDGERVDAAMLTPLAVRPDRQRSGIGLRLLHYALQVLEARGETLFFVLGHPAYYPRAGFRPASDSGIVSPWPDNPAFMAKGAVVPAGRLILPSVIANAH